MLIGSLTYTALLLPSEMFNSIPQNLGLEEHPQGAYFTGNVVVKDLPDLVWPVSLLPRLINKALQPTAFRKL